ncbi:hypothetical protein ACFVXC_08160 [Streptomyces sp. NPDC058257]|uniref:hypothetical protein n=1 Tax=Streptomyces sp. NPDC058257 TaxID=3346409 RepID=UPI0036EB9BFC
MQIDELTGQMTTLHGELVTGAWLSADRERSLAEHIVGAVGQPSAKALEESFSAVTLAIREGLRTVGPDVAPAGTDCRWAAVLVRCAAILEPHRVADSPEGQTLSRQLLSLCTDVLRHRQPPSTQLAD